jgi:uncharacterized protein (DUF2062 family)
MPKHTLKQFAPSPARLREIRSLRFLGEWIYEPNLWHINRYSAAMAFFVGLFTAFLPVPGQMVIAAFAALVLHCNLPLSVGLVWVTNPITMPAIFYLAYQVGALLLEVPVREVQFELSVAWLQSSLGAIWQPLLLGCLLCGTLFGALGYFVIMMLWRIHVAHKWHKRRKARAAR